MVERTRVWRTVEGVGGGSRHGMADEECRGGKQGRQFIVQTLRSDESDGRE